jgi:hypothetical protein
MFPCQVSEYQLTYSIKQVDYEKLGSLMSMKRASASSMYTRAINKLEKVYGVPREGGSAKSPAKAPTKKASGQKRRKRNQDPDTESEADSDTKVKAKSENPEEAVEAKEEGVISFNDQLVG